MFDNGINTGDLFSKYVYVFPCRPLLSTLSFVFFSRYTFASSYTTASVLRNQEKKNPAALLDRNTFI